AGQVAEERSGTTSRRSPIQARTGPPHLAKDIVGNGVQMVTPFFHGDRLSALSAEEHRIVARFHGRVVPDVDHSLVHADAPDDRIRLTSDENPPDVGKPSGQTGTVTDG